MAKRQTMQWDANVHEDILICMFQHLKLSNEDWTSVMAELQKLGYTFTESALRQHVQKLRKNRDTNATNALTAIQAAGAGSATTTTTPRKKATTTPRKRKNAKNTPADDDDVEDEKMKLKQENDDEGADELVSPSPMKRAKRTPKPEPKDGELEAGIEGET
ncbi:hypothetical protein NW755_000193 [Fusarium falciforme]|uniref:Uncharacterized protein n=1 Tax=Fusarium falciforme TaxID=195108 RepID=A0A9W8V5B7_9HYPO|nr:hypothetical protein NW755_000193 [Fusarium falciforme]